MVSGQWEMYPLSWRLGCNGVRPVGDVPAELETACVCSFLRGTNADLAFVWPRIVKECMQIAGAMTASHLAEDEHARRGGSVCKAVVGGLARHVCVDR
eukprot:5204529-Pleurochrysis_carterae.AAC.1